MMNKLLLILNYMYLYIYMLDAYRILSSSIYLRTVILLVILCISLFKIVKDLVQSKIQKITILMLVYLLYFLVTQKFLGELTLTNVIMISYAPIMFIAFSQFKINPNFFEKVSFGYILVVSVTYFFSRIVLGLNHGLVINSCYYLLLSIPSIYRFKSKKLKVFSFILVSAIVFFSMKRTALIVLLSVGLINFLLNIARNRKVNLRKLTVFAPVLVLMSLFIFLINQIIKAIYSRNIFDRFVMSEVPQNEGRIFLVKQLTEIFFRDSSLENVFFGRGLNATALFTTNGLTAHNDFIEVLFNFGLIGLVLYLCIYIYMIKAIMNSKRKNKDTRPFLAVFTIMLLVSLSSHLIFIPTYISILILNLSYKNVSEVNNEENRNIDVS